MAKVRYAYVTAYMSVLLLMLIHTVYGIITNHWAWVGTLLTILPIFGFFMWLFLPSVARTPEYLGVPMGIIGLGLLIALAGYVMASDVSLFAVLYSSLNLLFWFGYVFWYSRFGRSVPKQLRVGNTLPNFTAEDGQGNPVSAASLAGQKNLLMFYRGNWCPLCMSQVAEIAGLYRELDARGVNVTFISPQPHEFTKELADKFDVPFRFWVDAGNHAARQLGIVNELGVPMGISGYDPDTVYPTVVITDEQGEILLLDATDNYRLRPEPQTFLDFFDQRAV
ncbi:MAG: peroxiredoxin family protein [Chloroflexota bacterium]